MPGISVQLVQFLPVLGTLVTLACRMLLPSLVFGVFALAAAAEPVGPVWLDVLMQRMAAIPARQADFVEQKRIAALNQPLTSRGRLIYRRPSYIAKVTTGPEPETLIADGDRVAVTMGNDASRVLPLAGEPAVAGLVDGIRLALAGDLPALARMYRVTSEGDLTGWRLILTPLAPPVAAFLTSVTIEGIDTDIHTIRIEQANGDEQDMTLSPASQ